MVLPLCSSRNTVVPVGTAGTTILDGYFQGVITEVSADSLGVKLVKHVSAAGTVTNADYQQNGKFMLFQTLEAIGIHTDGQSANPLQPEHTLVKVTGLKSKKLN